MILCKWTNDVINRENKNILPVEGNHLKEILEETSWVSFFMAERRGFEPLKRFGRLLAFQAGQFNHSCIFPFCEGKDSIFLIKSATFFRLVSIFY